MMDTQNKFSLLRICNWQLPLYLGVGNVERQFLQTVEIDMTISFAKPPLGGENENLDDTVCYDKILQNLNQIFKNQSFKLIETLAKQIHDHLQTYTSEKDKIIVCIKKKPALVGLQGQIEYIYGDKHD